MFHQLRKCGNVSLTLSLLITHPLSCTYMFKSDLLFFKIVPHFPIPQQQILVIRGVELLPKATPRKSRLLGIRRFIHMCP